MKTLSTSLQMLPVVKKDQWKLQNKIL